MSDSLKPRDCIEVCINTGEIYFVRENLFYEGYQAPADVFDEFIDELMKTEYKAA